MASESRSVDLAASGPVELDQLHFDLDEPSEEIVSVLDCRGPLHQETEELSALSDLLTSGKSNEIAPGYAELLVELNKVADKLDDLAQHDNQSLPDVPKSTVPSKYEEKIPNDEQDALHLSHNVNGKEKAEVTKGLLVDSQEFQISVKESIRSLSDVMLESKSVPQNVDLLQESQSSSGNMTKEVLSEKSSGSEFEMEYSEQEYLTGLQPESQSDSEFEVPDRPPEKTEAKSPTSPDQEVTTLTPKPKLSEPTSVAVAVPSPVADSPVITSGRSHQFPKAMEAFPTRGTRDVPASEPAPSRSQQEHSSPKHDQVVPPVASSGLPSFSSRIAASAGPEVGDTEKIMREENKLQRSPEVQKSDDWENVTTIQAEFAQDKTESKVSSVASHHITPLLTVEEAITYFWQADMSAVKPMIRTSIDRSGCSAFLHFLFGPPKMHRDLYPERELVFCIAGTQLDNSNNIHIQALTSIHRIITGSRFDCPRYGSHWEDIGFQGRDPGTDLRGAGMLGLLQLLHLLRNPTTAQLGRDIYKLSIHPIQNFPFCVMGLSMTRICIQALRGGVLNKECNKHRQVVEVLNHVYVGAYLHLYQIWKRGKTILDSGHVIKDVETFVKRHLKLLLINKNRYLKKKLHGATVPTVEDGDNEFLIVCKNDLEES